MGLIKAITGAVGGALSDQWLEVVKPIDLNNGVIFTEGALFRNDDRRSSNTKSTDGIISNGSIIHVPENTCMLLVDGGRIIGTSAEPGYFKVDNSTAPSIFAGQLGEAFKETFERFKFGGSTPLNQEVYYVNLQEIRDIKFGTSTPLMYHDSVYDLDLEVRTHGHYSIKVIDPILFYREAVAKNENKYTVEDFTQQYQSEFMEALQVSIANLSISGTRITHLPAKGSELSSHMDQVLDDKWKSLRGIDIISVGINAITYTEDSKAILQERNKGSVLSDPNIRQGYVQGSVARGFENAGSNEAGAGNTFIGMGMGANAAGGMFGEMTKANQEQIQQENQRISESQSNQNHQMAGSWTCAECNTNNVGNYCSNCGNKKPEQKTGGFCSNCGFKFEGEKPKFCPNCGNNNQE